MKLKNLLFKTLILAIMVIPTSIIGSLTYYLQFSHETIILNMGKTSILAVLICSYLINVTKRIK